MLTSNIQACILTEKIKTIMLTEKSQPLTSDFSQCDSELVWNESSELSCLSLLSMILCDSNGTLVH